MTGKPLRVVVLISGRGTNLQSLIDGARAGDLPIDIVGVISNRPGAAGLERAAQAGIATHTVDHKAYPSREAFESDLRATIDPLRPDLIVLAGFMRRLTDGFVARYEGRMINIHPSLLPAFKGLHTHERALEAGVKEHGASVHFVTPELDGGPVIAQIRVPVLEDDDPDALAARILKREHELLPEVVHWFAQGRLELDGDHVRLDGTRLMAPVLLARDELKDEHQET